MSDGHVHDLEGHLRAVATDLEYFRRKRLEPRVTVFIRRGLIRFADLLRAAAAADAAPPPPPEGEMLEQAVRRLEDSLDDLIHDLGAVDVPLARGRVVIEDTRVERGDYDPAFRFAPREYDARGEELAAMLHADLAESHFVLRAFTDALIASGQITAEQVEARRRELSEVGYRNGARIVARAWVDPDFKARLLAEGRPAVRELDIPPGKLGRLGVAENTDEAHHVVVCTLCSCYPHDLLGNPPWWYRTDEYKQRIIEDPRGMLREMFDFDVPPHVTIRVHDSTSDVRWMVLPQRPPGTEEMSEDELAELVTPESLVGVAYARSPRDPVPVGERT
jgi:nitrile hydratase subunit alpha